MHFMSFKDTTSKSWDLTFGLNTIDIFFIFRRKYKMFYFQVYNWKNPEVLCWQKPLKSYTLRLEYVKKEPFNNTNISNNVELNSNSNKKECDSSIVWA